jgi:hypothetical protein
MLSKSRYLKGLKCTKALWLNKFKKEAAFYPETTLQVFAQGNIAGELAQEYFPGGQLALVSDYPDSKAIARTKALIAEGETTIYEATFAAHDTLVAVDILHQIDGKWHAFEVKSTNSIKETHVQDAAIQYYVMTQAGITIEDISIMYFDRTYVRQGDIEPKGLFTYQSVKDQIGKYLVDIPTNIEAFLDVYKQDEPVVPMGKQCNDPYGCEFAQYCSALSENKISIEDTNEKPPLSAEINHVNSAAITNFLKAHPYPIHSLDFETIMYGIPEFDQSRPYQQIPFQYSLHTQKDVTSAPEHFEFLGNGTDDPREALIQSLISNLGNEGSILVYSIAFERTRLRELARDFPKYKVELSHIEQRLVDLLPIFRTHLKTEVTNQSASLKVVLPTFLPHHSYQELDIQDGMATMAMYRSLVTLPKNEALEAEKAMLDYCKLDTLAVLELYKLLYGYV